MSGEGAMLSRRNFAGALTAAVVVRRGSDRPAPAPPAVEPNLARILRTKKLRIAGFSGEEPYSYKDPATGRWNGFWVAMAGNLAAQIGVELAVAETDWADSVTDLHTGKMDLSYAVGPTAQRAMFADFANPLFHDTYAIVARKGFGPKSWAELNVPESLVAVDIGSAREEMARRFAGNAAITGFKTRDEALGAVQSARADCFVATVLLALAELKKNPQTGEIVVPTPHLRAAVCPAIPYDDDRRFHGVVDAWSDDNRGVGQIQQWIMAGLAKLGIAPDDLPAGVSF
jgi:polar amino acid transport system substrate-binding protein